MMERHVRRMRDYLAKSMEAAGIAGSGDIHFEVQGRFFAIAGIGVEIALQARGDVAVWCVREVYDVPDLEVGGHRVVVESIEEFALEDAISAAKRGTMHAVERRIDLALDETA